MRNAKKTLSLVMIAIFTTFIVLSGIPAGAATVNTAAAKKQVATATAAVVKAEGVVKVATFNVTTAKSAVSAATVQVKKVASYGKTYTASYQSLTKRLNAVNTKIAAKVKADAEKAAIAKQLAADKAAAETTVAKAEELTNTDTYDLVGSDTDLTNAQNAVTDALEAIVKLDKDSADYKGLMARIDAANANIVKAMEDRDQIAQDKADADAEAAAVAAAETAVKAVEAAPLVTADDLAKALDLGKTAATAVGAVKEADKVADFTARLKAVADKAAKVQADLEEAKKPATLVSVSAVDGTITVTFNKKPLTTPVASDFVVAKSIGGAAATTVTASTVNVTSDTAVTLTVPATSQTTADQSVVYSVTYGTGTAVSAAAYTVAQIPALTATATATNLLETVVVFNQAVDSTTANTKTNYAIGNVNPASAVLQADGKTVVLTWASANVLKQQTAYTLAIAGVKSAASGLYPSLSVAFTPLDLTVPTVLSAKITGPTTLAVTFSEPVDAANLGSYSIDNNTYSISGNPAPAVETNDSHTVDVTLATTLPAGAHTVAVTGAKDYNGFKAADATLSFNYAADTTLPTVSVASATQNTVKLTFSKPMTNLTNLTVYHTYNNNQAYAGTVTPVDSQNVTVTFSGNYLPLGNATIYVNNANTTNPVKDAWSNALAATSTFTAAIAADTAAPAVSSIAYADATHIKVTFSKAVAGVIPSLFTLTGASSGAGTVSAAVPNSTNDVWTLQTSNLNGDTYTLAIAGNVITDTAVVPNKLAAYTGSFTVADTTPPTFVSAQYSADQTKMYVAFSEKMATSGLGSVLDVNNYRFSDAAITAQNISALPAGTTIALGTDGKSVIITLPAANTNLGKANTNFEKLLVGQVKDLAGNYSTTLLSDKTLAKAFITLDDYVANSAKTLSTTTLSFAVDTQLSAINIGKFSLDNNNTVTAVSYVNNSTGAVVTVTAGTAWKTDATPTVTLDAGALTNTLGISNIATGDPKTIVATAIDTLAPSLTTAQVVGASTIDLTYSENIYAPSVSIYTYTVAGNTVTNATVKNNNVVELTLGTPLTGTDATASVTQVLGIMDDPQAATARNTLAASTTAITVTDGQAPTATPDFTVNANQVKLTFSEAMNASTLTAGNMTISIAGNNAATITKIDIASDNKSAVVTISDPIASKDTVKINASSVKDANGNYMAATTYTK